ncbi:DUF1702 family protein [Nocardia panacis]|uniref:DUF1702 family protein n=1 Tax=Nocardia panacis TaxID=2340916 RepID=A0A3A4JZA1_9NOCA|nr:DUF1702 family protein [Nocardia panacis]RJO72528.1 DUF1702 family protein [Nocardia panacis]
MVSLLGRLRHMIFTPDVGEASLAVRGFPSRNSRAAAALEGAGTTFITGLGVGTECATAAQTAARLAEVDSARRGFAFEGAAMAMAIRDGLPLGHRRHLAEYRAVADEHRYMTYVGAGWALARLPRPLHRAALSGLTDQVLIWLALDGYGFHQAYFHTDRYIKDKYVDPRPPLVSPDHHDYAPHAVDQGIGRALWFVSGADPALAHTLIERFAPHRRADLYAGLGLAATYAGGASETELAHLIESARDYRECLWQGAIFAAEARARAGLVLPETEATLFALTGLRIADASRIAIETLPTRPTVDGVVAFEVWRTRIRSHCPAAAPMAPKGEM